MNTKQILQKLQIIFGNTIGIGVTDLSLTSDLREDLGASDIELAEIFSRLEDVFAISLHKSEIRELITSTTALTVERIVELIQEEVL